jgi:ribosomal protein S18 acetylase RimI-like enzyme
MMNAECGSGIARRIRPKGRWNKRGSADGGGSRVAELDFIMVTLRALREGDDAVIGEWFNDKETAKRLEAYVPLRKWLVYMKAVRNRHMFMACDGDRYVGMVDLELEDNHKTGYIAIVVGPEMRGNEYGVQMVRALLEHAAVKGLDVLLAGVEHDNASCLASLRDAGFTATSEAPDKDGFINLSLPMEVPGKA